MTARSFTRVITMGLASTLLATGMIHATQPYFFVNSIGAYKITPPAISGLMGIWLPYLQIVIAICMIFRLAEKVALCFAAGIFATFAVAQMTILVRGMEIDCGCFGFVANPISRWTLAFPAAATVACSLALLLNRGPGCIDDGPESTAGRLHA